MNNWLAFLAYAKDNKGVPKSITARSEMYQEYKKACMCKNKGKLCNVLNIQPVCKPSAKTYDPNNDPIMLKAKIKAYEDIVKNKDILIEHYEKMLSKHSLARSV